MKVIIKILFLFVISALAIYFMYNHKILDMNSLKNAFLEHKKILFFIAFLQVLNCVFMTARYFSLLRIFKINTDFHNVTAATFVSNGIGQWLPGSMAFIEVIRIGLMLGAEKFYLQEKNNNISSKIENINADNMQKSVVGTNLAQLSLKSKLLAISILDRLIGIGMMLSFGIIFSSYAFFLAIQNKIGITNSLVFFVLLSLALLSIILLLPTLSKSLFFRKFISRIERIILGIIKFKLMVILIRKIFEELNSILDAIALGSRKMRSLWIPIFYSCLSVSTITIATYFSAKAISAYLPFHVILAVLPMISLASLVPMGLAGMGGMQLVAALLFSIFDISPLTASSAQLLQTAVNLVAISCMGLLFARLSAKQINAILKHRKNKNLLTKEKMSDITDI